MRGLCFQVLGSLGVFGGLRGLCFQDTLFIEITGSHSGILVFFLSNCFTMIVADRSLYIFHIMQFLMCLVCTFLWFLLFFSLLAVFGINCKNEIPV